MSVLLVRRVAEALTTEFEDVTVPEEGDEDQAVIYAHDFEAGQTFEVRVRPLP